MDLNALENSRGQIKVILFQSTSKMLEMFVEDKVKRMFNCNKDTTLYIESKKDIRLIKEVQGINPPFSKKWLAFIDLKKVGANKDLLQVINESSTVVFFCKSERYSTYKMFKDMCKKVDFFFDFYISSLRRLDFYYLYSALVPTTNKLTKQMYDYVAQSYSADIEAVMNLFIALADGVKIENRKDISEICGIGGNSIESFVISLLKNPSTTERGVATITRNRIKAGLDLADVYGWEKFYSYLNNTLTAFIDIKVLCISGTVYKQLSNLPDNYDEKKISRYQRYLWRLKEIPLSRILRLKYMLGEKKWTKDLDFIHSLYAYICDLIRYEVSDDMMKALKTSNIDTSLDAEYEEEIDLDLSEIEHFKMINERDYSGYVDKERFKDILEVYDSTESTTVVKQTEHNRTGGIHLNITDDMSPLDVAMLIAGLGITSTEENTSEKLEQAITSNDEESDDSFLRNQDNSDSLNNTLAYLQVLANKNKDLL